MCVVQITYLLNAPPVSAHVEFSNENIDSSIKIKSIIYIPL